MLDIHKGVTPENLPLFNPNKTKSMRELGPIDISAVREDILAIPPSVWTENDAAKPNKFVEFKQTEHIVFKFVDSFKDYTKSNTMPIWEEWKDRLLPLLEKAVEPYGYEQGVFSRIMLAKLAPKGAIDAHKDGKKAAIFPHKIHIPIQTNPGVKFFINPKNYYFEEGHAYEVNNRKVHFVENEGDEARIHLIFEYWGK
jgi:hypothetical protein